MTADGPVSRPDRALAIIALVAMVGGIVVALGDIVSLPMDIVAMAATSFAGSIVVFVFTYRDARSRGSTFGACAPPARRSLH